MQKFYQLFLSKPIPVECQPIESNLPPVATLDNDELFDADNYEAQWASRLNDGFEENWDEEAA